MHVNQIFASSDTSSSLVLIFGAILFSIQIYGDFSGYSDMAIGFARLLGFKLTKNFDFPFFSTSMTEMWRRWHITLSTWTGEYIFLPLSQKWKQWGRYSIGAALMSTFVILGIWHGANWTFVLFGFFHGTVVTIEYFMRKQIIWKNNLLKNNILISFSGWGTTMLLWLIGMIFFRSESIGHTFEYIIGIISRPFFGDILLKVMAARVVLFFTLIMLLMEWICRNRDFGLSIEIGKFPWPFRWVVYYALIFAMIRYPGSQQDFIYFQF